MSILQLGVELEEAPVPRAEELAWEKELLGVYVSEHPYTAAAGSLQPVDAHRWNNGYRARGLKHHESSDLRRRESR